MPTPRKTLDQIDQQSLKKHRGRYTGRAPGAKPKGKLGAPSASLRPKEREAWLQLVRSSPVLLGESDRTALELCAVLKAKLARGNIRASEMALLISTSKLLGLIAANRTPRGKAPKPTEYDEFSR